MKLTQEDIKKFSRRFWEQRHRAIGFSKMTADYVGDRFIGYWQKYDIVNFFRKQGLKSLLVLGVMIGIFIGFGTYHDEIKSWAGIFVEDYGMPALFLLTWIADTTFQPIPPDIFVFGSTFGGADIWRASVVAGVASACGGTSGYFIGRCIGPLRFRRLFGNKLLITGRKIFHKYGIYAITVAALTPLPYSGTCWIAGIYKMSPIAVFLTSMIGRILRYIVVGWLGYMA